MLNFSNSRLTKRCDGFFINENISLREILTFYWGDIIEVSAILTWDESLVNFPIILGTKLLILTSWLVLQRVKVKLKMIKNITSILNFFIKCNHPFCSFKVPLNSKSSAEFFSRDLRYEIPIFLW